jgi:hypothetical protein
VREINVVPQDFTGPNYEKLRTILLKKERQLLEDVLRPTRSSWSSLRVSIILEGRTNTRRRPLINVIASSPKGAMFLKEKACSGEVKDSNFIAAIEQVGPENAMQVITYNIPVCKDVGLIVEGRYDFRRD